MKMKSCVTLSLVPALRGGPWILWDELSIGLEKAHALGFDAVELFTEDASAGKPGELARLLEKNDLSLGAVGTGAGKVIKGLTITSSDQAVREQAKSFIVEMIYFGAEFAAPAIIGSMQGNCGKESTVADARKYLGDALSFLGEKASQAGTFLLYEPLNRYETNLFNHFEEAADFLDEMKIEGVRLLADLFHMNIEEKDIASSLLAGARRLGHVHYADSNRRAVGFGHTPIEPIAQALKKTDFEGYISAEVFDWPDPESAAKQTISSFRKHFS